MKIAPFPGTIQRETTWHKPKTYAKRKGLVYKTVMVLNDEQQAWLVRWFPEVENAIIAEKMGISMTRMHRFATDLGLTKSEKGMRAIKRRQAKAIKRTCEASGYYASIKGRKPSEACQAGTARMWEDIKAGRRPHPIAILKKTAPNKYTQSMKRRSEQRKEMIRMENKRIQWGLPRQTRMRCVVETQYSISQRNHRYNALKRGYFVMRDCSEEGGERYNIYYDQDTTRSEKFERNLVADGFTIKEWT